MPEDAKNSGMFSFSGPWWLAFVLMGGTGVGVGTEYVPKILGEKSPSEASAPIVDKLDEVAAKVQSNSDKLSHISRSLGTLRGKVGSLSKELGEIDGDFGKLDNLQGRVGRISNHVRSIDGRVRDLEGGRGGR